MNEAPWERIVDEAVSSALAGGLIVVPTDTVYGIGTRPDDPAATERLFEVKGRPHDLGLPILVATRAAAEEVAVFDDRARALAGRFWPGPLSIVLPRAERAAGWTLGSQRGSVALRVPHHPLALALLARTGPLAVTSANRTGEPTPTTCEGLRGVFGEEVEVYLCAERPLEGRASTVVDLTGSEPVVVRAGDIGLEELGSVLDAPTGSSTSPR